MENVPFYGQFVFPIPLNLKFLPYRQISEKGLKCLEFGKRFLYIHPGVVYHPMNKLSGVDVPLFQKMILIPYPGHFLSFALKYLKKLTRRETGVKMSFDK